MKKLHSGQANIKNKSSKNTGKPLTGALAAVALFFVASCNPPQTAMPAPPALPVATVTPIPAPSLTPTPTISPSSSPQTGPSSTTTPASPIPSSSLPPGVGPSPVPSTVMPPVSPTASPVTGPSATGPTTAPVIDPSDRIAPTVKLSLPADNATHVALNFKPAVAFSEPMDPLTITTASFRLTGPGTTAVPGKVSFVDQTATFTPTANLNPNTVYTASMNTTSKDLAGNALASDFVWRFTTGSESDTSSPTVISTLPLNGATNVQLTVQPEVNFSEAMDPLTLTSSSFSLKKGTIAVLGAVSTVASKAVFKPTANLEPDSEYTATLKAGSVGVKDLAGNALTTDFVWTFKTIAESINPHFGPETINLGSTGTYGVLSNTSVTLAGAGLRVKGDVGIFPAGACNGCDSTTVSGVIAIGAAAEPAMASLESAYNDAMGRTTNKCTLIASGNLVTNPPPVCGGNSNGIFAPGLYWSGSSIAIPAGGTITLDGKNDPSSVFIFQSESTINSIGGNTHMVLTNGAKAKNIFWVAGSSATIGGTTSDFAGTVIAMVAGTVNTGTQMNGRILARTAAVTVQDGALITVPTP